MFVINVPDPRRHLKIFADDLDRVIRQMTGWCQLGCQGGARLAGYKAPAAATAELIDPERHLVQPGAECLTVVPPQKIELVALSEHRSLARHSARSFS